MKLFLHLVKKVQQISLFVEKMKHFLQFVEKNEEKIFSFCPKYESFSQFVKKKWKIFVIR